ncbi:unnamed protein product [Victoria cruziana]
MLKISQALSDADALPLRRPPSYSLKWDR